MPLFCVPLVSAVNALLDRETFCLVVAIQTTRWRKPDFLRTGLSVRPAWEIAYPHLTFERFKYDRG